MNLSHFPRPLSPVAPFFPCSSRGSAGSPTLSRYAGFLRPRRGGGREGVKVATRYGVIRKCTWPIKASRLPGYDLETQLAKVPEVVGPPLPLPLPSPSLTHPPPSRAATVSLGAGVQPFQGFYAIYIDLRNAFSVLSSCLILLSSFYRVFPARETRPCTHFACWIDS